MARKRRAPPPPVYEAGTVTVVNASSRCFRLWLGLKLKYEGTVEPRELDQALVEPGENNIRLKVRESKFKKEDIVSWTLGINEYGVLWRSSHDPTWQEEAELHEEWDVCEKWSIDVVPNGTYYLDNDPQNTSLTDAQFDILHQLLLGLLQKGDRYSQLWHRAREHLATQYKDEFGSIIPEKLGDAYDSYDYVRRTRLPNWQNQYPMFQLKADPNKAWATQDLLDKGLSLGGNARIDVYWRALDRQPGGNTDTHTICYTFDCANQTVSTRWAHNSDSELERSEYTPEQLSKKSLGQDPTGPFANFLAALRSLGPGDSDCTIMDTISQDPDEYDTEWSSHEIVVFLPRPWHPSVHLQYFATGYHPSVMQFLLINQRMLRFPSPLVQKVLEFAAPQKYAPVLRLHQKCRLGPRWRSFDRLEQGPEIPPSSSQQAALNAAKELVGMGRVNTWSDAGDGADPCEAQNDVPLRPNRLVDEAQVSKCTLHPFYFDYPAINLTTANAQPQGSSSAEAIESQRKRPRDN